MEPLPMPEDSSVSTSLPSTETYLCRRIAVVKVDVICGVSCENDDRDVWGAKIRNVHALYIKEMKEAAQSPERC